MQAWLMVLYNKPNESQSSLDDIHTLTRAIDRGSVGSEALTKPIGRVLKKGPMHRENS